MRPHEDGPAQLHAAALALWAQHQQPTWITLHGHSMLPLLRPGDQLWVTPAQTTYRRGAVVVCRHASTLVIHRLIGRQRVGAEWHWLTQGDHCLQPDPPLPAAQLAGKVIAVRRGDQICAIDTLSWRLGGWLIALASRWAGRRGWWRRVLWLWADRRAQSEAQ